MYVWFSSGIKSWTASCDETIFPGVPVKTLSHLASNPSRPWLSVPQNPIKFDAKLLYG